MDRFGKHQFSALCTKTMQPKLSIGTFPIRVIPGLVVCEYLLTYRIVALHQIAMHQIGAARMWVSAN